MNIISDSDSSENDAVMREKRDAAVSSSLCLPLELNGQSVQYALCDQGATRSCMRASALARLNLIVIEHKLDNHYVVCSSGEEIPLRSRFPANISSQGVPIGESLTYVVEDKPGADIVCDMVLGRASLASSDYNCIDTQKGTIFNKDGRSIQCHPATFINTVRGKHASEKYALTITVSTI